MSFFWHHASSHHLHKFGWILTFKVSIKNSEAWTLTNHLKSDILTLQGHFFWPWTWSLFLLFLHFFDITHLLSVCTNFDGFQFLRYLWRLQMHGPSPIISNIIIWPLRDHFVKPKPGPFFAIFHNFMKNSKEWGQV